MNLDRPFVRLLPASLLAAFALVACGEKGDAPKPRNVAMSEARKEAVTLFQSLCSTCHGTTGHGDGPGAAACEPKPRSFADAAWQSSVTDEHIVKTVTLGGAAVGKSPQMPAQPQLKGKTEVLQNLVEIVRNFAAR